MNGLTALLKDQSMVLRASAAVLLGRQADDRAEKALIDALDDPHPMVRTRAVEGLMVYGSDAGIEAVIERLDDPSRLVRVRSASMLEGVNLSRDREKLSEALMEYRTMVTDLLADDPEAQVQVGIDALQQGDDRAGEIAFRQALKVWPGMPDAYAGLGTVFIRNKQFSEAVKMWREAAARDSALVAPLHHACELWETDIRNRLRTQPGTARDYTDLGDTYTRFGILWMWQSTGTEKPLNRIPIMLYLTTIWHWSVQRRVGWRMQRQHWMGTGKSREMRMLCASWKC